jgi:hypothetical protein
MILEVTRRTSRAKKLVRRKLTTDQGQSESPTESNDVAESQEESGSSVTNAESVVTTSDIFSETEDTKNKVTSDGDEA